MLTTIIFDIDGTILDTENAILKSLQQTLREELQQEYELHDLRMALGIPGKDTLKKLNVENIEEVHAKWSEAEIANTHEVTIFEELENVLKKLADSNLKLGIVTSKTRKELVGGFEPFGLSEFFEQTICACDTNKHKPNPEPLLACLELLKVSPGNAIYIGDSIYDFQCAKSAGVKFALALWGSKTSIGFEEADFILKEPKDILNLI